MTEPVTVVKGKSLAEAWEASIRALVGVERPFIQGSVGGPFIEGRNFVIVSTSPNSKNAISPAYRYGMLLPNTEAEERIGPAEEIEEIRRRIEEWPDVAGNLNQIESAVAALRKNLYTRRAVISLWDPSTDPNAYNAICPCYFQLHVREDAIDCPELHGTLTVRSSNAWMGAMADMWLFSRIQISVADQLAVPVGTYVHHAVSYHLYEQDIVAGRNLLIRRE